MRFGTLIASEFIKAAVGDGPGALRDLAEADSLGQLDFTGVKELAEMHSTFTDVAPAVATFDRAADMEPSNARVRQQRGACKNKLGDLAGAIADLDAAIQLGLDNALTYMYKGETNMQLGQLNIALADLDQAVAKKPNRSHYWADELRAEVKYSIGDPQGVVADMDLAHEIQPLSELDQLSRQYYIQQLADSGTSIEGVSTADALCRLARAKCSKADYEGALSALDTAFRLQPQDARLYHERETLQMRSSNHAEALQDLQTLIDIDSKRDAVRVLSMCGVCKGKLGQHQEALVNLNKAFWRDPNHPQVLRNRAAARFTLFLFEGALADENPALQVEPESALSLASRGSTLCMLGRFEAALADLDKANELQPDNSDTLIWRHLVKGDQGDWAGAIADLNEAEHLPAS